ncbi:MAG: EutN/CcmL family microcompartment protein [Aliishimia sp.]
MRLGKVTGTITATLKAAPLNGHALLLVDVVDAKGGIMTPACVASDTVGAGVGDMVLLSQGSAARMAAGLSSAPVDLAIVAIVDRVSV